MADPAPLIHRPRVHTLTPLTRAWLVVLTAVVCALGGVLVGSVISWMEAP